MNEPTLAERQYNARTQGYFAYFSGKKKSHNPYAKYGQAPEHCAWNDGWDTAEVTYEDETKQSQQMNAQVSR